MSSKKHAVLNKLKGWTLVEMVIAMIALAILIGLSVQIIKPKKLLRTPFAYAGLKNLRSGVTFVMNDCYEEKVAGCTDDSKLPDSKDAINILAAQGKTLDDDVLCNQLANAFTIIGDVHCAWNNGSGESKLPVGNTKGIANFQTSNMVSYYYLERPWIEDVAIGQPVESSDGSPDNLDISDNVDKTKIKEIMIDLNGDDGPNKIGDDQFPLRVYIDGYVMPSTCTSMVGTNGTVDKSPYCNGEAGNNHNYLTGNYPFAYSLIRSSQESAGDMVDPSKTVTKSTPVLQNLSYVEAACRSGRNNYLPRLGICQDKTGAAYEYMKECWSTNKQSYCLVWPERPNSNGLFRLPIF